MVQDEQEDADNTAFLHQGCHAFYLDNCHQAHVSNIGEGCKLVYELLASFAVQTVTTAGNYMNTMPEMIVHDHFLQFLNNCQRDFNENLNDSIVHYCWIIYKM